MSSEMREPTAPSDRRLRLCVALALWGGLGAGSAAAEVLVRVPQDQSTLQAAIGAVPDGGTIELAAGTYPSPTNGWAFANLGKGFTVRAAVGATVSLDGGGARPIFRLENTSFALGRPIVFERIIFSNGRSTVDGRSGGVTLSRAEATFVDCLFAANRSDAPTTGAGGIGVFTTSVAYFNDCEFQGNLARNEGGAMVVGAGSSAFVHRSLFFGNRTNVPNHRTSAAGGAVHVGNSRLRVTSSRFDSNEAGFVGGAIYVIGDWTGTPLVPSAELVIANSTFIDNRSIRDATVGDIGRPEGGALHGENQATIEIHSSRFHRNSAGAGGAMSLYRAEALVSESIFQGNSVSYSVNASGGTIAAFSNDTAGDGANNRHSASITIQRSLLQGRFESVGVAAHKGGCLSVDGDFNRRQGVVLPSASASATRATAVVEDSYLVDCDARDLGGGFDAALTNFSLTRSLVIGSDATGACPAICASGGGGRFVYESLANITDSTFSANTAAFLGGALLVQGAEVNISDSRLIKNSAGNSGAAIYSSGLEDFPLAGQDVNLTGVVSGSVFSENAGVTVVESDSHNGPINDMRFNSNTFYISPGTIIYSNPIGGSATAAQLNALIVNRSPAPDTDKSQVNNSQPGSAPVVGDIVAAPASILNETATGDPDSSTEAFLGYAWSGATATLDGGPLGSSGWGSLTSGLGVHTLAVGGQNFLASIAAGALPAADFSANPPAIASGGSSTLSWALTSGDFLEAAIDQGRGEVASSGSQLVTPVATTTYRLFIATEQGGRSLPVTVYVDEAPIFIDGFESGNTAAWS